MIEDVFTTSIYLNLDSGTKTACHPIKEWQLMDQALAARAIRASTKEPHPNDITM
jgi:hypothetical protein